MTCFMSKLRKSAKGEACQVRVPFVCNSDTSTTVLAHINGSGMGMKNMDIHAAYCCSKCHDAVDSRVKTQWSKDELKIWHYEGMKRTQELMVNKGLIEVCDG